MYELVGFVLRLQCIYCRLSLWLFDHDNSDKKWIVRTGSNKCLVMQSLFT